MKTCPVCGETYSERIDFCFNEGAALKLMPSAMDAPMPRSTGAGVPALDAAKAPRRNTAPPLPPEGVPTPGGVPQPMPASDAPAAPSPTPPVASPSTPPPPPRPAAAPNEGSNQGPPDPQADVSTVPPPPGGAGEPPADSFRTEPPPRRALEAVPSDPRPAVSSAPMVDPYAELDDEWDRRRGVPWIAVVASIGIALLLGVTYGVRELSQDGSGAPAVGGATVAAAVEAPVDPPSVTAEEEGEALPEFGDDEAPEIGVDVEVAELAADEPAPPPPSDARASTSTSTSTSRPRPTAGSPAPSTPTSAAPARSPEPAPAPTTPAPAPRPAPTPAPAASSGSSSASAGGSPWDMPTPARKAGTALFTSDPSGATVRIDGRARGRTPLELELEYGTYQLELELPGHSRDGRSITVASERPKFPAQLDPLVTRGNVLITADGWEGALLYVDGAPQGRVPTQVMLQEGMHTFVLKRGDAAKTSQRRVRLAESGVTRLSLVD